jgi:hypothetical protein
MMKNLGGFLTFNPYFEWEADPQIPFQARHSDIAPYLMRAIDICTASGVEANVRYMPPCQLPGYEQRRTQRPEVIRPAVPLDVRSGLADKAVRRYLQRLGNRGDVLPPLQPAVPVFDLAQPPLGPARQPGERLQAHPARAAGCAPFRPMRGAPSSTGPICQSSDRLDKY